MFTSELMCPVCLRKDIKCREINSSPASISYDSSGVTFNQISDYGYLFICPSCGDFAVTYKDYFNLTSPRLRNGWDQHQLSALLREQSIQKLPRFWLQYDSGPYTTLVALNITPISLVELLTRWPRTVSERIDRTLCNLARLSPTGGHRVKVDTNDIALAYAQTEAEARFHIDALTSYGLLVGKVNIDLSPSDFLITPFGWSRFEKLTQGVSAPENPVFVAMWFGEPEEKTTMDELFKQSIEPAITEAGYRVARIDLSEHNDWIMDKILGDIRLAPFVVADFTGNRNGVYFEAGFARGLGIPVIHTCRKDDFDKAHFDTKQLNHILWDKPSDLRIGLYNRIVGTIGQGPHPQSAPRN